MSLRLFVYYSAVCGAAGGLLGWAVGRLAAGASALFASAFGGLTLGLGIALALGFVETAAQLSLRQRGLTVQRLLAISLFGGAAGFLGGLCVHRAGLLIGWGLTGTLIGAAPGLFDWLLCVATGQDTRGSRRKAVHGLLGGLLGGFAGALLALIFRAGWGGLFYGKESEQLWSPGAWGCTCLGAGVCAAVGLLRVLGRQSWLRIEQGCLAGCEVLLSRPLVTLGRGDRCDVGLNGDQGAEPLHARLEQHGKRYLLLDAGSRGGTFVNGQRLDGPHILRPGDLIQVGETALRFLDKKGSGRREEG